MAFTSFYFLIFIAAVVGCYYIMPQKVRWIVLLAASYAFYLISSPKTFVFILFTTVVTFFGGKYIGRLNNEHKEYLAVHKNELSRDEKKELKAAVKKRKRKMVFLVLLADFGVLAVLKYFRYYIELLAQSYAGLQLDMGVLIPLGISFYTFQSAAYIIDLYRSKIDADTSLPRFALFLSFFPQIIQGPIARYDQLAAQLYEGHRFSYTNFTHGMQLILWGFFKKLVIADRVAILVSQVFDNYGDYHGAIVFAALLGYSVQIYADFSGGIDIARGVAGMMGIDMAHNFMRPYFSDSISEFWRRWHMSLSFWCRDYIFYPISLSKFFGKAGKKLRSVLGDRIGKLFPVLVAQMATFITIGIWHGAEFKYIAYGLYNGGIIILGLLLEPQLKKMVQLLHINVKSSAWKVFCIVRTFFLIVVGRMFPKAESFSAAMSMYASIIGIGAGADAAANAAGSGDAGFLTTLLSLGLDWGDFVILLLGCIVWFRISWLQEKGTKIRESMGEMTLAKRWAILLLGFAAVLVLGVYGPGYDASAFIYRGF